MSPNKRYVFTEEHRRKISLSKTGLHHTEATKKLISMKKTGHKYPPEFGAEIRRRQLGEKSHLWTGGVTKDSNGYLRAYHPEHPYKNNNNYVLVHKLVVEEKIGRFLLPTETVHHINEIKEDNRPENLMVFKSNKSHRLFHGGKRIPKDEIIYDGRTYKQKEVIG